MNSKALWYFSYGSNMNRVIFEERRALRPLDRRHGWLEGFGLCFNLPVGPGERGVANLETRAGARTHGVLYLLTADACDRLDLTEGVHRGIYSRLSIDVDTQRDGRVKAFTYQSARTRKGRKPSARYLGLLLEGAREHGLPAEYIAFLQSFDLAVDEREGAPPGPPSRA